MTFVVCDRCKRAAPVGRDGCGLSSILVANQQIGSVCAQCLNAVKELLQADFAVKPMPSSFVVSR